jgi:hypothetical protein
MVVAGGDLPVEVDWDEAIQKGRHLEHLVKQAKTEVERHIGFNHERATLARNRIEGQFSKVAVLRRITSREFELDVQLPVDTVGTQLEHGVLAGIIELDELDGHVVLTPLFEQGAGGFDHPVLAFTETG